MIEKQPGRILAFSPGMEIAAVRPQITAEEILQQEATIPREDSSLDEIQISMLEATGNMLPEELITHLGFSDLRWQLLKRHNALAGIFLGASAESSGQIGIDSALGVVEIRSRAEIASEITTPLAPRKIAPSDIRLSGIASDSIGTVRAVGCLYSSVDLLNDSPAQLLGGHISVSNQELPPVDYRGTWHDVTDQYNSASDPIPSSLFRGRYDTSALITPAQVAHTENHIRALELRGSLRNNNAWLEITNGIDYPNPGFMLLKDNDNQVISFDQSRNERGRYNLEFDIPSDLPAWQITLPGLLEK